MRAVEPHLLLKPGLFVHPRSYTGTYLASRRCTAAVTDRYSEQRVREEDGVCDNLLGFLDILNGLKDLLDRQGKGIGKQMSSTQRRLVCARGEDACLQQCCLL